MMMRNPVDQDNDETKSQNLSPLRVEAKNIWLRVMPKLVNLVNITALLTVAGFFVVQSYLASFSRLFTFNINVTQYLAAGVNLVLAIFWNFVFPILWYGMIFAIVLVSLFCFGRFYIERNKRIHSLWTKLHRTILPLYHRIQPFLRVLWSLYQIAAGALSILFVILLALGYGTFYYAQSPRMFGGGMPTDVILVFREDQSIQNSVWGFPINSTHQKRSERVQLLIELTDGLIVKDPTTSLIVMVKNDVLQGVIDAPASNNLSNPTAIPTQLMPTSTP